MFELTYIGHAGWVVTGDDFKAVFDPWMNPKGTFFNSWHQFPDNSHLMSEELFVDLDFLYISHAHHDHCDIWTLEKICKNTLVIVPKFRDKTLKNTLLSLGFTNIKEVKEGDNVLIKNVKINMIIEDGFNDRDSCIILDDGENKIINLNDCHPSFEKIKMYSKNTDLLLLQCSSAIWWPCVYDYSKEELIEKCSQKRKNVLNRSLEYAKHIKPRYVVPNAGPPIFLNQQFSFWDNTRSEDFNPFPLHDVINKFYSLNNIPSFFIIPGSKIFVTKKGIFNDTNVEERNEIYDNVNLYIKQLRSKKILNNDLSNKLLPNKRDLSNLVPKFKSLIKAIKQQSKIFIHKINFPILINFQSHSKWIIDLNLDLENCFSEYTGQSHVYSFDFDPHIVSSLIERERIDFDEYFLSMRFKCSRKQDIFNEFLFTMFKNLDIKSFLLSENIYLMNNLGKKDNLETFTINFNGNKKRIQKFCPHKGVNLEKCGIIKNDKIICPLHNWCFDLKSGNCETADKYKLLIEEIID